MVIIKDKAAKFKRDFVRYQHKLDQEENQQRHLEKSLQETQDRLTRTLSRRQDKSKFYQDAKQKVVNSGMGNKDHELEKLRQEEAKINNGFEAMKPFVRELIDLIYNQERLNQRDLSKCF